VQIGQLVEKASVFPKYKMLPANILDFVGLSIANSLAVFSTPKRLTFSPIWVNAVHSAGQ